MTAQEYNIISVVSFALCGITAVFSFFLFFKLKIRFVLDELSGKNAEKQVEEIRKQNRSIKKRASILGDGANSYVMNSEISEKEDSIYSSKDIEQSEATTVLNETTLLGKDVDEYATVLLYSEQLKDAYITVLDIMEIHTIEVIEE